MALLEIDRIAVSYGVVNALRDVSLSVEEMAICAVLGPNGAGKSTVIRSVLGLVRPQRGTIRFNGAPITGSPTHRINRAGIAWVPEGRQVFANLTVNDNLLVGAFNLSRRETDAALAQVQELFPRLAERRRQLAGSLSGGEQQMLAIGRALMTRPRLILMDEPSLGLAPQMVKRMFELVRQVHAQGISVLIVEQNARQTLKVATHAYLLSEGQVIAAGSPEEIGNDESVRAAYLGADARTRI